MRTQCQPIGTMRQSRRQGAVLPWGCPRWVPPTPSPSPCSLQEDLAGQRGSDIIPRKRESSDMCDGSGANTIQLVQPPHGTHPVPRCPHGGDPHCCSWWGQDSAHPCCWGGAGGAATGGTGITGRAPAAVGHPGVTPKKKGWVRVQAPTALQKMHIKNSMRF